MSARVSPERLVQRLRDGAGPEDAELRQALGLGADPDDGALARELVRLIAERGLADVRVSRELVADARVASTPALMSAADASFLGRLSTTAEGGPRPGVAELEDVPTLLAILRAGTLPQRRAAARRLAARLEEGELSNDEIRSLSTTLLNLRDVEITLEVAHAREALPGAHGRAARQETEEFEKVIEQLVHAVEEFWSGQTAIEPVAALPPDQRAQLMVRLRDAPDVVVRHIASVLEDADGATSRSGRLALLSSVRYAGDPRLVPALVAVLASRAAELVPEAARALARIEDPRVHPALAAAYERSVVDHERATLAGALGRVGDVRGREYVRKLLSSDDDRVLLAAVGALSSLAISEDCERLIPLLERPDPVLLTHVIRALGRAGDPRGLLPLAALRRESGLSALFSDTEDAEAAIRALMELRGEEPPEDTVAFQLASASASGVADRMRDPIVIRLTSWLDFVMGHVWLAVRAVKRAVTRFERAASRRPGWAAPVAAVALFHARGERPAQALTAFRRALESDRRWVERNAYAMREMVRIFLRRAEEVEKSGRVDIARGLVEEVLALDLRRVPMELRFELSRRQEQLRLRGSA